MTIPDLMQNLNQRAAELMNMAKSRASYLGIQRTLVEGAEILDFGVNAAGGLEAGLLLSRICLSDLADVSLAPPSGDLPLPLVCVRTDHPIAACLSSQYAGWKIQTDDYFAMGSGPMRALSRREDLFEHLPETENGQSAVGVLEAGQLPSVAAVNKIRSDLPNPGGSL